MHASSLLGSLFRKKTFDSSSIMHTEMHRCLSVVDVAALAVGQMIGAGIYVLTGSVVRNIAGPSIVISFFLAGIAALLSAFSYAEFGARFPRAGSAYTYAYVGAGELWAFIIGWTVLLEYMIGNAAVARSWSGYFDNLVDNAVSNFTLTSVGQLSEGGGFFGQYPDILAFIVICFVSIFVSMGSKASATFNKFFVLLNLAVIAFVIVVGFMHGDFSLWVGNDATGVSRFAPFGISGTMAGAATVFFSFIGFEALATAGEEAKNPRTTIPLATFGSLAVTTTVYILMAASLTVMIPYDLVDPAAAYAAAFESKGADYAKYVVSIGALIGMMNNLVVGVFAGPRAFYAMAEDGLVFSFLAKVNKRTKVPFNSIIVFTLMNAVLALIFDLEALVEFLSIGTLMAYSFVSACVIILRHTPALINGDPEKMDNGGNLHRWVPWRNFWESMPEGRSIGIAVCLLIAAQFWLAINVRLECYTSVGGCLSIAGSVILLVTAFVFILGHQQNELDLAYKVPLVPFIPAMSLFINVFMMVYLNGMTWVRLVIWMAIGLLIYFGYGFHHSKEGIKRRSVRDAVARRMVSSGALLASSVLCAMCVATVVVGLPLFWFQMQRYNTLFMAQIEECKQTSNDMWRQMTELGGRSKRQYGGAAGALSGHCCSCQQGRPGPAGPRGSDGPPGKLGIIGVNGRNGRPGKYVVAAETTEPPCQKCPTAPPGPPGHPGSKGPRGNAGTPGKNGTPGTPGRVGPPGPQGIRGPPGDFGMQGPPGDSGKVLNGAPQGPPGKSGAIGARGKAGTAGRDGHPGVQGIPGARGTQGERGVKGVRGLPGPPGPEGPQGGRGSCSHCPNDGKSSDSDSESGDKGTFEYGGRGPPAEQPKPAAPSYSIEKSSSSYRQRSLQPVISQPAATKEEGYGVKRPSYGQQPTAVQPSSQREEQSYGGQKPASSGRFQPPNVVAPSTVTKEQGYGVDNESSHPDPYRARAAPVHTVKRPISHPAARPPVKAHGASTYNGGHDEPTAPYQPEPHQIKPAGYSVDQLSDFQPRMVPTRQGYAVQLVGGYATNPIGREWTHPQPRKDEPLELSPPGAAGAY